MKKKTYSRLILSCIFLVFLSSPASAGGRLLRAIHISVLGQTTRCVLETDGPAELSSHCLSKPERIYVDLKGFTLEKGALDEVKPTGLIKNIRAAQFDSTTVRVVFEFESRPNLMVSRAPGGLGFDLDFSRVSSARKKEKIEEIKTEAVNYAKKAAGLEMDGARKPARTPVSDKAGASDKAAAIKNSTAADAAPVLSHKDAAAYRNERRPFHEWRVVIDPGHGGHDPGTMSKDGHCEKDATLAIAERLAAILKEKPGYQVYLTRDKDEFISLDDRTVIANRLHADIFVSIHINSSPNPATRGITTYFLNWTDDAEANKVAARENAISAKRMKAARTDLGYILASLQLEGKRDESLKLANYIEDSVTGLVRLNHPGEKGLGVKQALFYVLVGDKMPAVLVEVSFLSNRLDDGLLQRPSYINEVARGIAAGIEDYFKRAPAPAIRTLARR
ncbi:MAG: N-acetylmuramoyl-L-alanine amidase [Nitrospiraceae bacterium]|nr:N-acetylmuramoyl-L-alanine amidase [Nitrospiraceae bacterium]